MARIQIRSVEEPFDRPEIGEAASEVLGLAEAMGLLPRDAEVGALSWAALRLVTDHIAKAGLARGLVPRLEHSRSLKHEKVAELLLRLAEVLEENPAPDYEWERLLQIFPSEELAGLLGISPTSVARYRSGDRKTPDSVAARLHFLARVLHPLEGAYNELGVRRWFQRRRTQLEGKAPADFLKDSWEPEDEGPKRVLDLARSLRTAAT